MSAPRTSVGYLFALCDGTSSFCQGHWAGPIRGTTITSIDPAHNSNLIDDKRYRQSNKPTSVTLVSSPNGTNQLSFGIAQQAQGIRIKGNVGAVLLTVASHPLFQFSSLFRMLDADTKDLNFFRNIPFRLVDKGRYLGPAPGSPAATVEKNDACRGLGKDRWKFHGLTVDILQPRSGKIISDH